jgi:hypothetical protein
MWPTLKLLLVIVLCFLILGVAWFRDSADRPAISVSVQTSPETVKNGDKAKILLRAESNGSRVSHGDVLLAFWPLDLKAAAVPRQSPQIVGCTDTEGLFITSWSPPCTGLFMMSAEVGKSGYVSGRKSCWLAVRE